MHWRISSLRMFWGWAYLPVCVVPPLLWGCLSKLQDWQVLNYDEYLMVYFLFLVGLWRMISLKLINKQEISALCATSSIITELSSIYCYCYYHLCCSWRFASFSRRREKKRSSLGEQQPVLSWVWILSSASLCWKLLLDTCPRAWGRKDEYSMVPAFKSTRHRTSRGTRTGRGPGSVGSVQGTRKWCLQMRRADPVEKHVGKGKWTSRQKNCKYRPWSTEIWGLFGDTMGQECD